MVRLQVTDEEDLNDGSDRLPAVILNDLEYAAQYWNQTYDLRMFRSFFPVGSQHRRIERKQRDPVIDSDRCSWPDLTVMSGKSTGLLPLSKP